MPCKKCGQKGTLVQPRTATAPMSRDAIRSLMPRRPERRIPDKTFTGKPSGKSNTEE